MVGLSIPGDVLGWPNAYVLDMANGANMLTIAVGHSLDTLNHVLGEFVELSAVSDLRRPLITIAETGQQSVKTATDQIGVVGTLTSGETGSVHFREAVVGGTGFLWEMNGTVGTLQITADAAYPEIYPLAVTGAQEQNELAEFVVPTALTQQWPSLTSLEGAPAYNVGVLTPLRSRHRQRNANRAGLRRRRPVPRVHRRHREVRDIMGTREGAARARNAAPALLGTAGTTTSAGPVEVRASGDQRSRSGSVPRGCLARRRPVALASITSGRRRDLLARRDRAVRGPQLHQRGTELVQRSPGDDGPETCLQFVFKGLGRLCQQPPPRRRELDNMRAAVARVSAATAQASGLDTVDELARAADGDRQLLLDIKDTARRVPRHHLHRLEPGELQVMVRPKPSVNGIPQISLETDQLAEQHLQIRHDPLHKFQGMRFHVTRMYHSIDSMAAICWTRTQRRRRAPPPGDDGSRR
jgi:hypothetical protein